MHGDLVAGNMALDPFVGGRRAAAVVLGLEAVDRDDPVQGFESGPRRRQRAHGACDELNFDAHALEPGQDLIELAIANERLASHDRDVHRPQPAHEIKHSFDELRAPVIAQLPERDSSAEVVRLVCVAARTTKRTLLRDLERKQRRAALENAAPAG
jgi:hypothetical protein